MASDNDSARYIVTFVDVAYYWPVQYPLTAYIQAGLDLARYDKLKEGSFAGEIFRLVGVVAFGPTLRQFERELRSSSWKTGNRLPSLAGISLNRRSRGRMEAHQAA